jgi:hypothetical protein
MCNVPTVLCNRAGAQALYAHVEDDNVTALTFYAAAGFVPARVGAWPEDEGSPQAGLKSRVAECDRSSLRQQPACSVIGSVRCELLALPLVADPAGVHARVGEQ